MRLGRQVKGAQELVTAIEPFYTDLVQKTNQVDILSEETEFKRDSVALADANLDDKVRDLYEACKKYDRDHPGLKISARLFPAGTTPVVYAPTEAEPTMVADLIKAIQNLGEGHPLAEHIPLLQAAIADVRTAIEELHVAINAERDAEGTALLSKNNLTQQYGENIHNASIKFGNEYANRLFPPIKPKAKAEETKEKETEAK
jgi:hypothetical protein